MKSLFTNRSFWLFAGIYVLSFGWLAAQGQPVEEMLAALIILGIALPLIALAACARLPEPGAPLPAQSADRPVLAALFVFIVIFLALKGHLLGLLLPSNPDPRLEDTVNTLLKLAAFVLIPVAVMRWRFAGWPSAGARTAPVSRLWLAFLVLSVAVLAVQLLLGSGVKRLLGGEYAERQLVLGSVLCFAWMAVEAGLVEEFFFRWFLQTRLAALTGSQLSAIFLTALAFGLAHAPGIWLRGQGVMEGLGEDPSFLTAFAYSVTTQGVAAFVFGVLWARTRSFLLVVGVHAMVDAPANTASFMDTWGL